MVEGNIPVILKHEPLVVLHQLLSMIGQLRLPSISHVGSHFEQCGLFFGEDPRILLIQEMLLQLRHDPLVVEGHTKEP